MMHGDVEDDGAGGLKWKESSDRVGHFEYTYGEGPRQRERISTWFTRQIRRLKGDIVYATKHQDDVCGKKCEFDPVTGKCLKCEAMNKKAREEAEAAMARDAAE